MALVLNTRCRMNMSFLGLVKKFDHRWITNLERLSERELKYVKKWNGKFVTFIPKLEIY